MRHDFYLEPMEDIVDIVDNVDISIQELMHLVITLIVNDDH